MIMLIFYTRPITENAVHFPFKKCGVDGIRTHAHFRLNMLNETFSLVHSREARYFNHSCLESGAGVCLSNDIHASSLNALMW